MVVATCIVVSLALDLEIDLVDFEFDFVMVESIVARSEVECEGQ